MAKHVEEVVVPSTPEENEEEVEVVEEKKPKSKGKDDDGKPASEEAEGDGEEEEEYEIAAILDAKRGYFGSGKYGYLVAWKGYDAEHNSWVNEDDAVNADDLIKEYWRKKRQDDKRGGRPRKSEPTSSIKARKSVDKHLSPPPESASAKRGRGRPRKGESAEVESADEEESEDTRAKKKKATGNGSTSKAGHKSLSSIAKETDQDGDITMLNGDEVHPQQNFTSSKSLKGFSNLKSWEDKVKDVTTVERVGEELMVYFITINGDCVRETSTICASKFPQKLIKFYESHLRWRMAGAED